MFFFFFSSRRRHTRWNCDWSSDVCSSDLFGLAYAELRHYEDAQDAVASALLQICTHIQELREPARVREWMQSIVRNEIRRLRRGRRAPVMSLEEADGHVEEDTPSLLRLDIERALRQLPGNQA